MEVQGMASQGTWAVSRASVCSSVKWAGSLDLGLVYWLTTLRKVADLEPPRGTTGLEEEAETVPFCNNAKVWELQVALIRVDGETEVDGSPEGMVGKAVPMVIGWSA